MADVPWPLWPGHPAALAGAVGLGDATWRVLTALWRLVDSGATAAGPSALWASREAARRPCVWPANGWLQDKCELCEKSVRNALGDLEKRGLLERGYERVEDRTMWRRVVWLTDPETEVSTGMPDRHEDAAPRTDVPDPVELPAAPLPRAPTPRARRPAPTPVRPSLQLLPAPTCREGEEGERSEEAAADAGAAEGHEGAGARGCRGTRVPGEELAGRAPAGAAGSDRRRVGSLAAPTDGTSGRCQVAGSSSTRHPADQHPQQRPASTVAGDAAPPARPAATTSGTSAGRRWDAVELIVELGMIHLPAPAQRIAADRRTRERAEQLLELPLEGLSEDDAQAARRARFEAVLATAKSFTRYLEATPEKRHFWRGGMLSLKARARADGGDGTSPWEAVEKDVAEAAQVEAELERGREAARAMVAAQATEAERVAAGRVTPELAAAGASELFRRLRDRETAGSTG